jgi:hypothetical protein
MTWQAQQETPRLSVELTGLEHDFRHATWQTLGLKGNKPCITNEAR